MNTSTTTLPAGTLASDLAWNDDLAQVHQRMAYHEGKLGLLSRQTEDIVAASHYLRSLAVSHTKAEAESSIRALPLLCTPALASDVAAEAAREAAWETVSEAAPTPATVQPSTPAAPVFGHSRLTRAFAGAQPAQITASTPPPQRPSVLAAPTQSGPTGVKRLAAAYARAAKTSTTN